MQNGAARTSKYDIFTVLLSDADKYRTATNPQGLPSKLSDLAQPTRPRELRVQGSVFWPTSRRSTGILCLPTTAGSSSVRYSATKYLAIRHREWSSSSFLFLPLLFTPLHDFGLSLIIHLSGLSHNP